MTDKSTPEKRAIMDKTGKEFNQVIYNVAAKWQAKNMANFTVKVQPFPQDLIIPNINYISEFDCFHPSAISDEAVLSFLLLLF